MDRILASPGFVRNDRLCGLLRFIVEQKLRANTTALKETVIGTEVFGRKPGYDTHSDPVVRMEASKLRARLARYYAEVGAADPVRIEIPKGGYIPLWRVNQVHRRSWRFTAAVVALGLVVASVALWQALRPRAKPTVAVLPFVNLGSDPEGAYFGDGLADEITGLLSRTEGLEVIARTSAFALRDARLDAREIGARLNATVLVEGSVRKAPDRLKVIVQLIRAADGKHLWANTYERAMQDVFVTEEEIAASIVNALRLKLGGRRRYTDNPQAFELYLRGRYAYDHVRRRPQLRAALHLFEEAAASDTSYAPAYAGIANTVLEMGGLPYSEARSRAMAAVEKALQLDPALPEAYFALAEIKTREYAWPEAERAFRRAIELDANDAQAHGDLGLLVLAPQGRFEDAVHEVRRAQALDPLSPITNEDALFTLFMAGRYREAEDDARKDSPINRAVAQGLFARALSLQGRHDEAMEATHAAERLGDRNWNPACVAARAGRREEALQKLHEQVPPFRPTPAASRRFFMIYACLGDKDRALEYAEKMYAEHEPLLPTFLTYPETAWLRTDPAFANLRERIGLPR